jgi:hypothetical protein
MVVGRSVELLIPHPFREYTERMGHLRMDRKIRAVLFCAPSFWPMWTTGGWAANQSGGFALGGWYVVSATAGPSHLIERSRVKSRYTLSSSSTM